MSDIKFVPVRGTEEKIMTTPYHNGYLYFALDTGKIFIDANNENKVPLGGGGVNVLYSFDTHVLENADGTYSLALDTLEDENAIPKENDLIINSDGRFFKISFVNTASNTLKCDLIAVSGTGGGGSGGSGGGGGGSSEANISLTAITQPALSYIYGQSSIIEFKPVASADLMITLTYKIINSLNEEKTFSFSVVNGNSHTFDLGINLYEGLNKITVSATGENSGTVNKSYANRSVVKMSLNPSPSFYPLVAIPFNPEIPSDGKMSFECVPVGAGVNKTLQIYIDGIIDPTLTVTDISSSNAKVTVQIPHQTHGQHIISAYLSTELNGVTITTDPLIYEVAWIEQNNLEPIIWLGEYNNTIVNYSPLIIPFMVYDPRSENINEDAEVNLYQNDNLLPTSPLSVKYDETNYINWNITTYAEGVNVFKLSCRGVERDIIITVTPDSRDLSLTNQGNLMMNLSSGGRSNRENATRRAIWQYNNFSGITKDVVFNNFNWYNNGWATDNDNNSYLSVSNGASITIPFEALQMNQTLDYTFEVRFKIRNIQDYSTLITNETWVELASGGEKLESELTPEDVVATNEWGYDKIKIKKTRNYVRGVCGSYVYDEIGFCIGTQEAFFYTGTDTVSVRYKEDELISLAFVISKTTSLISIYLNGILSGVTKMRDPFAVRNTSISFNSNYCDIDLYNVRAYRTALDNADIVHNYISDKRDILLYDQNQIYEYDETGAAILSYQKLIEYNRDHPEALTMPYMVIETLDNDGSLDHFTVDDDRLPYYKGNKRSIKATFINPNLDKAWQDETITDEYYINHCPSFEGIGAELNVQGTSSQGYPRRNYKCKFKSAAKKNQWKYLNGPQKDTPFKAWHMDNPDCATNVFTWKVDYMESSGSYNTGFANLINNLYDQHPMEYYNFTGVDASNYRTSVYGFPVLVFHKHNTSLNDSYEFIGRYNFNLDKGSNEFYGYEDEAIHPYILDDDGEPMKIADVAECWEFSNNQGTWTSFKYPQNPDGSLKPFTYVDPNTNKLEIINHFEYRYNNDEDNMDLAYEYAPSNDEDHTAAGLTTMGGITNYLIYKHRHLQQVFEWLASTDTTAVSAIDSACADLDTPVSYTIDINYKAENINSTLVKITDENNEYIEADVDWINNGQPVLTETVLMQFTKDTARYRLEKFKHEFTQHFNLDYCLIYFIMTELLLLYDSRGKNMMLASFGPQEINGNYIWFPVFYDIDTQLGINNTGIPTWDYDVDASIDGTFSTAQSVLWTNLYNCFNTSIQAKYRTLRAQKLNYEKIKGAYNCDPAVFTDSYAMRGVRPLVAINFDEYYKYLAVMYTGYYPLDSDLSNGYNGKAFDGGSFLYACQGNRALSRELFIRNRLNYIDSWWRAAGFDRAQGTGSTSMWMRINANDYLNTSDKFIDMDVNAIPQAAIDANVVSAPYNPLNPLESTPDFSITPFLKQYVTVGYDDNYTIPIKYNNLPVVPTPAAGTVSAFEHQLNVNSQLVYIPGAAYLSDVGDLSQKYLDEFHFASAIRVKELKLGSDASGYVNNKLGKATNSLILEDSKTDMNKKTLLQNVLLNNLNSLSDPIDVSGSEKLIKFRALNTLIPSVVFAEGAPLTTVHLPKTISTLNFVELQNLNTILTSKPVGDVQGLYLEDITDATYTDNIINVNTSPMTSITIDGGNLGYNSYTILNNIINIKKKMLVAGTNTTLGIHFSNVEWSPFKQVSEGSVRDLTKQYYQLGNHYEFLSYDFTDSWDKDLFEGKIYEYNEASPNLITSLDLLNTFIDSRLSESPTTNYFKDTSNSLTNTLPYLSGNIHINNSSDDPIDELLIKNYYNVWYPNLKITVAHSIPAWTAKYVERRIAADGTQYDYVWGTEKIESSATWFSSPFGNIIPLKQHYDFIGWGLTPDVTEDNILTAETWDDNLIDQSSEDYLYTFYAIFEIHSYTCSFINDDNTLIKAIQVPYNSTITPPMAIPHKNDNNLPTDQCYKFVGYSLEGTSSVIDFNAIPTRKATHNEVFVAQFLKTSVYNNVLDEKYLTIEPTFTRDGVDGYALILKKEAFVDAPLVGKITLPTQYNGQPIIAFGAYGFSSATQVSDFDNTIANDLTYIFFDSVPEIRAIDMHCFLNCSSLCSFGYRDEFGNTTFGLPKLTNISHYAFRNCPSLLYINNLATFAPNLEIVGTGVFNASFSTSAKINLTLGSKIREIGQLAFSYFKMGVSALVIGDSINGSALVDSGSVKLMAFPQNYGYDAITVYFSSSVGEINGFANSFADNASVDCGISYQPIS